MTARIAGILTGEAVCTIIFCMHRIYTTVLQQERNTRERHRFSPQSISRTRRLFLCRGERNSTLNGYLSDMLRSQGLWYSRAFVFTFVPATLYTFWENHWIHFLCIDILFHWILHQRCDLRPPKIYQVSS